MNKYYDQHTLYVRSGVASKQQLRACIDGALKEIQIKLKQRINCQYWVNLVSDGQGLPRGYGYIWVSNPIVYNILIGLDQDGKEREVVKQIPDPNWKEPEISFEEACKQIDSGSWADDDQDFRELEKKYQHPFTEVKVKLAPLVTLPPYTYDETQKKHVEKLGNDSKLGYIQVSAAWVSDEPDKMIGDNMMEAVQHKLVCKQLPAHVTIDNLHTIFDKFNSLKYRKYPKISISGGRAFIEFEPGTRDASFAKLMTRCIKNFGGVKSYMTFDHFRIRKNE